MIKSKKLIKIFSSKDYYKTVILVFDNSSLIIKTVVDLIQVYNKKVLSYQIGTSMSRIIIKNIPKNFSEKEIKDHFKSFAQDITDCIVARSQTGQSRKFAFLGLKDPKKAQEVRKNFHNTYLGASKIQVDMAKSKDQANNSNKKTKNVSQFKKSMQTKQMNKKYNQYKQIVNQGNKKSWQDVIAPSMNKQPQAEQQVNEFKNQHPKSKKQILNDKKQRKNTEAAALNQVKAIKAPKLSQKNKKFLNRPLDLDQTRLYITNLPYNLEQEDFKKAFQKYGNITKVKLPKQYDGKTKGFGFITFQKQEEAMRTFSQLDGKILFGRIIHVKPALEDVGQIIRNGKEAAFEEMVKEKYGDGQDEKTSYKKKKKRQMRQKLNDTTNWNTLFLNPNTILERVSRKLKITKSEILMSQNLAPKVALAETEVIQQTQEWMKKQGLNVDFLQKDRSLCERSQRIILVKNLNHRIKQKQLRQLFEFYGIVVKVLLAPNRAIAIVQFQNDDFAKNAFEKLQNHKFKNNFLYLEYAPVGMISEQKFKQQEEQIKEEIQNQEQICKVVYIKNLNFETQDSALYGFFEKIGPLKYARIVKSKQNKSMGYGFVQYQTKQDAQKALKNLQNKILDGHKLIVTMSRKKAQTAEKIKHFKTKIQEDVNEQKHAKLSVKNLAFQASKKDIEQLFKQFGSVKTIRLPKKMDGSHRGFAFVEYDSVQDAALAKQALSNTHLYGRKLVLDYEKGTSTKNQKK